MSDSGTHRRSDATRDDERGERWRAYLPVAALAAFVAVVVLGPALFQRARPAPNFSLPLVGEQGRAGPDRIDLASLRGKVVLVDFWATWCGPCQRSTPVLTRLQRRFRDRGLVVLGVNTDEQGPELVPEFRRRFGLDYDVVYDEGPVASQWSVRALPTMFLLDRTGMIRSQTQGFESEASLAREIERLL